MAARGHIRLRLMLKSGFGGANIGLTDHYSVPYDSEDALHNVYNCVIEPEGELAEGGKLKSDRWQQLDLTWDTAAGTVRVDVDEQHVCDLREKRQSDGVCYLRLRSTAPETDLAGFLVESVDVNTQP